VSDDFYHDDPVEEKTTKKFRNNLLTPFALIIASVFFFQTTLAGNITLSSGTGIEFGQGITQTVACSGATDLTLTPYSTFANGAGSGGTHYLSSVTVSGIPSSCDGVDFTISAYGNSANSPLAIFNTSSTVAVVNDVKGAGYTVRYSSTVATISGSSSKFTLTFVTPVASSSSVFKLTLQSGEHIPTCAEGGKCVVGDMGPGGGTVFYVSTGFTETGTVCNTACRYLEAAPVSGTNAWTDLSSAWSSITNVSAPLAQQSGIGFGYQNTQAMYTQSSAAGYPAASSIGYRGPNNFSDWFIPSNLEAMEMFKQKNVLAFNFPGAQARYWSSTETSGASAASKADAMYTISGGPISINKNTPIDPSVPVPVYSRAVRAF
jgi:hypothetical protein